MAKTNAILYFYRACAIALSFIPCAATADDAMLQICLGAAADYSPVFATSTIPASAQEVTAVFRFPNDEIHKGIVGTWIAVDVGNAAPPNHVVMKTSRQERATKGRLWLSLPRALPIGKYRLEVEADGKPWKSVDFTVVQDIAAPELSGPDAMLATKQTWTYDFMQEAGAGAHLNMPGVKPDAQGRYRAKVTMTVIGKDSFGQHVEMRRNGQPVFEEWWRLDQNGLAATKRKSAEGMITLDPPQVLVAWPLGSTRKWEYSPRDGSYHQTYKMFGPLSLQTTAGQKPGYVIFVEQSAERAAISVERHFVPGVGFVRETIIQALDRDMISRQEMVLTP